MNIINKLSLNSSKDALTNKTKKNKKIKYFDIKKVTKKVKNNRDKDKIKNTQLKINKISKQNKGKTIGELNNCSFIQIDKLTEINKNQSQLFENNYLLNDEKNSAFNYFIQHTQMQTPFLCNYWKYNFQDIIHSINTIDQNLLNTKLIQLNNLISYFQFKMYSPIPQLTEFNQINQNSKITNQHETNSFDINKKIMESYSNLTQLQTLNNNIVNKTNLPSRINQHE